jgi:hypothetical protein
MQKLIALLPLLLAVPHSADAQDTNALRAGVRVEVTSVSGKTRTGRIMSVRNDSVFYAPAGVSSRAISTSDASSFALADVKSVRVSTGRNAFAGAVSKGLIGTGIGILSGMAFGMLVFRDPQGCSMICGTGVHAAAGGVIGGAFGLIGGVIYGASSGGERWENVPLPGK